MFRPGGLVFFFGAPIVGAGLFGAYSHITADEAPSAAAVSLADTNSDLIEMGASYEPTVPAGQLEMVASALEGIYDLPSDAFDDPTNLYTPEGYYTGTYQDGEIYLLNELASTDDPSTIFGVSQSAGIIGMVLEDVQEQQLPQAGIDWRATDLNNGVTWQDIEIEDQHWVALAPPTMPEHGNAYGLFERPDPFYANLYHYVDHPFPTNVGSADVFCGLYDSICDYPALTTNQWLGTAQDNSQDAGHVVHNGYGSLTSDELAWEAKHSTTFTIDGQDGDVTIYDDLSAVPDDQTAFHLMPDIVAMDWGLGHPDGPTPEGYDSLLPLISGWTWDDNYYESILPEKTLNVDLGYMDKLHPYQFMIDGTHYTAVETNGDWGIESFTPYIPNDGPEALDLTQFVDSQETIAAIQDAAASFTVDPGSFGATDFWDFIDFSWILDWF